MGILDWIAAGFLLAGGFFFFAGTVGLLRFPDVYTRLHALTKVDNLGLGLTLIGLALRAESWLVVGKLVLIWLLVLLASATAGYLMAGWARAHGIAPWRGATGQKEAK
jgi:multicomponent Na+:H+ antiporter subunit G